MWIYLRQNSILNLILNQTKKELENWNRNMTKTKTKLNVIGKLKQLTLHTPALLSIDGTDRWTDGHLTVT